MKALAFLGAGKKALKIRPEPELLTSDDAIIKIMKTTICSTDLHILSNRMLDGHCLVPCQLSSRPQ